MTAKQEKESNTQNAIHHFNRQNTGIMLREGFVDRFRLKNEGCNNKMKSTRCCAKMYLQTLVQRHPRLNSIMNYIKEIFYLTDTWMKPIYCLRFGVSIMIQKSFYGKPNAE